MDKSLSSGESKCDGKEWMEHDCESVVVATTPPPPGNHTINQEEQKKWLTLDVSRCDNIWKKILLGRCNGDAQP